MSYCPACAMRITDSTSVACGACGTCGNLMDVDAPAPFFRVAVDHHAYLTAKVSEAYGSAHLALAPIVHASCWPLAHATRIADAYQSLTGRSTYIEAVPA